MPPAEANIDRTLVTMQAARDELGRDPNVRAIQRMLRDRVTTMAGPQLDLVISLAFAGRPENLLRSVRLFVNAAGTRGVERTSTGTANVLYLALLLERLHLRRENHDGEDTLLAVEEPEAHLHPSLQRHVFAHLLGQPNRLVLTTHSPHIAAVTPLHSLVLVAPLAGQSVARVVPPGLLSPEQITDLERYLNVTRAEILFARHIVLVEGAAETYVLPALATAAGFDLDGHGIVVAAVEGTDFAPYARLLGPQALNRPFAILTDGDVTDSEAVPAAEPGLARVLSLLRIQSAGMHEVFRERLVDMVAVELPDDGEMRPGRLDLVRQAADVGIFVGEHTLEVDIAPLLADEMTAAFNELAAGQRRQQNFAAAVNDAATGAPTAEQQDALLSRIDRIGKGRYAQRLAAHVTVMDLPARVRMMLEAASDDPLDRGDLLEVPGCGALLALLDDLRRKIQGLPLLPTDDQYSEWREHLEYDNNEKDRGGQDHVTENGVQNAGTNDRARADPAARVRPPEVR